MERTRESEREEQTIEENSEDDNNQGEGKSHISTLQNALFSNPAKNPPKYFLRVSCICQSQIKCHISL